ncbi:MAG: hypothetical protein JWP48_7327 [Actinoallomurus sp.]|nr:hypothetical protein [Actinoallomurus sp.]
MRLDVTLDAVDHRTIDTYQDDARFALPHWFRRLRIRWEIRDDIHEAFLSLACSIICWRPLANLALC